MVVLAVQHGHQLQFVNGFLHAVHSFFAFCLSLIHIYAGFMQGFADSLEILFGPKARINTIIIAGVIASGCR